MSLYKILILLLLSLPMPILANDLVEQVQVVIDNENTAVLEGIKGDLSELNTNITGKAKLLSQRLVQIIGRYSTLVKLAERLTNDHKSVLEKDKGRFSVQSFTKISHLLAEWRTLKLELAYLTKEIALLEDLTQKLSDLQESLADKYLAARNLDPRKVDTSKLFSDLVDIGYTHHSSFFDGETDLFWSGTTDEQARHHAGNVLNTVAGSGTLGILAYAAIYDPEPITKAILSGAVVVVALVSYFATAKIKTDQNNGENKKQAKKIQDELTVMIFGANKYYLDNRITKEQMLTMVSDCTGSDEYQKIKSENKSLIEKLGTAIANAKQVFSVLDLFLKDGETTLQKSYEDYKNTLIVVRAKKELAEFRQSQVHDAKVYSAAKYWHNTLPEANKTHSLFYFKHIEDCHLLDDHAKDMVLKYELYRNYLNGFKTDKNKYDAFFTNTVSKIDDFITRVKDDADNCYKDQESVKEIPAKGGIPALYQF